MTNPQKPPVTAVLGPTNTGYHLLALERMLAHRSGMMGFPLRLLARENYDRVVRVKGSRSVALITGEERIIPPNPSYFICTVESMPVDRRVAFLAVDEVQLAADPDRGHVFTDRILHARGTEETMFLGSDTVRPLLRRLVPGAEFVSRPRFSSLEYAGAAKLTQLPRRSAVVAFTANDVYALAEQVRHQRGGAAVVLGALSPRTRNAQVALYQAGEVDYLVATDAIGMGLNMDVDHVTFAATQKFDGRQHRALTAPEMAQIAGRAGRHMNDGTFGTTQEVGGIEADIVSRVEEHSFNDLEFLHWRNTDLRFRDLDALLTSLRRKPELEGLARAPDADDLRALEVLADDPDIREMAQGPDAVRLLWTVCQVPDFSRLETEAHTRLLRNLYANLMQHDRLPQDWLERQVSRLDAPEGDIEQLMGRIAAIRTWTYVTHRPDWVDDPDHWQERTRMVEDRLSDALHEQLTQRFIDKRTSALVKRLGEGGGDLVAHVDTEGEVRVEGYPVGHIEGFRFVPDDSPDAPYAAKAVFAAAQRALKGEVAARTKALTAAPDTALHLDDDAVVTWRGAPVATLSRGSDPLRPQVEVLNSDLLDSDTRELIRTRLATWMTDTVEQGLAPLPALLRDAPAGPAAGLAYQLAEGLGAVRREQADQQIRALDDDQRGVLTRHGVRFGVEAVFLPVLLKPAAVHLRGILWAVFHDVRPVPPLPPDGRVSVTADHADPAFLEACGFRPLGPVALRLDMLERIAFDARKLGREGPFRLTPELMSLAGLGHEAMAAVLAALGFRREDDAEGPLFRAPKRQRPPRGKPRGKGGSRPARGQGDGPRPANMAPRKQRRADPGHAARS
mgnify:CR=1 FL=1